MKYTKRELVTHFLSEDAYCKGGWVNTLFKIFKKQNIKIIAYRNKNKNPGEYKIDIQKSLAGYETLHLKKVKGSGHKYVIGYTYDHEYKFEIIENS